MWDIKPCQSAQTASSEHAHNALAAVAHSYMTRQSDLGRKLDGILAFQYIYILFTLAQVLVNRFLVRNIFINIGNCRYNGKQRF